MDYDKLKNNTNIIIDNLYILNNNVSKIKKKIILIKNIYLKLQNNKILINDSKNSFLIFQATILNNEHNYYKN